MIQNYFLTAWRNLLKNRFYSFIICFGLSLGIAVVMLIYLFIKRETSYDQFHENKGRIARVIMDYQQGDHSSKGNFTSYIVGPKFKQNFPEIEEFIRIYKTPGLLRLNGKLVKEKNFIYVDSSFLKAFSFKLIKGDLNALKKKNALVLTQTSAKKYFGYENPIGKSIWVASQGKDFEVTAIAEDCPENSHIKFDFLASFHSQDIRFRQNYWNANFTTYLLLHNPEDISVLDKKIKTFVKEETKNEFKGKDYLTFHLEDFSKIHLHSEYEGFEPNGSMTMIYMTSIIGLIILLIACFTFVNMSIVRSAERGKEVGVRKVIGAVKQQIFFQFITEAFVLTFIAIIFGLLISSLLMPTFNNIIGTNFKTEDLLQLNQTTFLLVLVILVSLLTGIYPAFIFQSFLPIKTLKGVFKNSSYGLSIRQTLFVLQFALTVILVICTFIIKNQLQFIQNKPLGFNRENIVVLPNYFYENSKLQTFITTLKSKPEILHVSRADFEPNWIKAGYSVYKEGMKEEEALAVSANPVDENYVDVCGLKLIQGANINLQDMKNCSNPDYSKNTYAYLVNETALSMLGIKPENAIGKQIHLGSNRPGIIKGVIKDFHYESLHNAIGPLVLFSSDYASKIFVKYSGNSATALEHIKTGWDKVASPVPFEFEFVNDNYTAMYKSEQQFANIFNFSSGMALLLSFMGLFGFSAYSVHQHKKEIAILKVFGASIQSILVRLSKTYLKLILLSAIIAIPVAWYISYSWLQNFSYKISPSLIYCIGIALLNLIFAFLVIGLNSVTISKSNPSNHLRAE